MPRRSKLSAIDVTAKAISERLVWVPWQGGFAHLFTMPSAPTPPGSICSYFSILLSFFRRCNFLGTCSNLAELWYHPARSLQWQFLMMICCDSKETAQNIATEQQQTISSEAANFVNFLQGDHLEYHDGRDHSFASAAICSSVGAAKALFIWVMSRMMSHFSYAWAMSYIPPKNGEIALQTPRTSRLLDC